MRNEIILNGKTSKSITGLIIQSLPPISMPQTRTQIEEIDGKDGDIVTKLGFASYDKTFIIGLSYNYNIDDVIAFFQSSGTVIFSNEPGKYYNYQILNQIDFERLIRFKTANVTMHVQPFKYSNIETTKSYIINNHLLSFENYTETKNGITFTATSSNSQISITGIGTQATEFYLPLTSPTLLPGQYTFNAIGRGSSVSAAALRLIYNTPTNENSFGGTYLMLQSATNVSIQDNLNSQKTYNYLYFYIAPNATLNFTCDATLSKYNANSITIINSGNYFSKPTITIYGSGNINLNINQNQIFIIQLGNDEYITIDAEAMEAYKGTALKNRLVTGNYEDFVLNVGENSISWSGDVNKVEIENYSRWL